MRLFYSILVGLATIAQPALSGTFYPTNDSFPILSEDTVDCPPEWFDRHAECRTLEEPFGYYDSILGLGFEAPVGLITDGASIPNSLTSFVGDRYAPEFARAATLHDWYVHRVGLDEGEYSYLKIQRMFYHALIDSDVAPLKAKIMYLAVLVGANKYELRIPKPPQNCNLDIDNCLHNAEQLLPAFEKSVVAPAYGEEKFDEVLKQAIQSKKFQNMNPFDVSAIESLAIDLRSELGLPEFSALRVVE